MLTRISFTIYASCDALSLILALTKGYASVHLRKSDISQEKNNTSITIYSGNIVDGYYI